MAINLSPSAITDAETAALLAHVDARRLIIEITEHVPVDDYPQLRRHLASYRRNGARLAVDDTGAGFASFSHPHPSTTSYTPITQLPAHPPCERDRSTAGQSRAPLRLRRCRTSRHQPAPAFSD